jgi:uncharacterized membrane protein YoaK (UPF0700 family)
MTTNTTRLAINLTELALAWGLRRRTPANSRAAAEYSEISRRVTELWPVMLGFLVGTLAGAISYVRLDLWCVVLPIAIICALSVWATASRTSTTTLAQRHLS